MINISGHDIRMTPEAEVRLVQEAKAGNKAAEKMLLDAYMEAVKDAHRYSAVGMYPSKLGYNYNFKGINFEEHGEPLAQIHHRCIQLFDFEKKHKTAPLPYLKYLLDTISYRALDYLDAEKRRTSHEVTASDLQKSKQGDTDWEFMNQDDLIEAVACKELMHDNAAQEQKDAEVENFFNKVLQCDTLFGCARDYMKLTIKMAKERVSHKNLMGDVMKKMRGKDAKRNGGYYYEKMARNELPENAKEQFRDILQITGE